MGHAQERECEGRARRRPHTRRRPAGWRGSAACRRSRSRARRGGSARSSWTAPLPPHRRSTRCSCSDAASGRLIFRTARRSVGCAHRQHYRAGPVWLGSPSRRSSDWSSWLCAAAGEVGHRRNLPSPVHDAVESTRKTGIAMARTVQSDATQSTKTPDEPGVSEDRAPTASAMDSSWDRNTCPSSDRWSSRWWWRSSTARPGHGRHAVHISLSGSGDDDLHRGRAAADAYIFRYADNLAYRVAKASTARVAVRLRSRPFSPRPRSDPVEVGLHVLLPFGQPPRDDPASFPAAQRSLESIPTVRVPSDPLPISTPSLAGSTSNPQVAPTPSGPMTFQTQRR